MKKGKAQRAMEYIDDELIISAMDKSDLSDGNANLNMNMKRRKTMKQSAVWRRWVAVAAVFAIVLTSAVFIGVFSVSGSGAIVAMDVNPSIEIEINRKEEVIEVKALNEDAKIVIGDMNFDGVALDVAINDIIASMVSNGYISVEQNSILVSINSRNDKKAEALKSKLLGEIENLLGDKHIAACVITQIYKESKENSKNANDNAISPAKAALISKIVDYGLVDAKGVPYSYEVLAQLKVNDLKLILESKGIEVNGINASGVASLRQYISSDEAIEVALLEAGVKREEAVRLEAELDYDDDLRAMVYEIEFIFGEQKYEYEINARNSKIIEGEVEPKGKDDDEKLSAPEGAIDRQKALEIAYADAGLDEDAIRRPKIELDKDKGVLVYEVEFKSADKEYEYVINVLTGEILEREVEIDD